MGILKNIITILILIFLIGGICAFFKGHEIIITLAIIVSIIIAAIINRKAG